MTRLLEGKAALVAGAGRGIGRAIALAYASEGARLALASRSEADLARAVAECAELGADAIAEPADVSRPDDVAQLVSRTEARLGQVDVLVVTAGIYGPIGPSWDIDPDEWWRGIEVNLRAPFLLCQALVPRMVERGLGKIILLGGGGAAAPLPRFSSYAASKAGLVRLAETLAQELAPTVQVNVIAPGLVDTTLQDHVLAAGERAGPLYETIRQARETGKGAVPPELAAELAVFLASDRSGQLTGKLIAAQHDPWRTWNGTGGELNRSPLYTLRRLDPFTIRPLIEVVE